MFSHYPDSAIPLIQNKLLVLAYIHVGEILPYKMHLLFNQLIAHFLPVKQAFSEGRKPDILPILNHPG